MGLHDQKIDYLIKKELYNLFQITLQWYYSVISLLGEPTFNLIKEKRKRKQKP